MKASSLAGLVLTVAVAAPAAGQDQELPEPGVRVERTANLTWMHTVFPGVLLDYVIARSPDGGREIVALVRRFRPVLEPEADPGGEPETADEVADEPFVRKLPPCPESPVDASAEPRDSLVLFLVDPERGLVTIESDLDPGCRRLAAANLDQRPGDEIVVACRGKVLGIHRGPGSIWETDVGPRLLLDGTASTSLRLYGASGTVLGTIAGLGRLELFGPKSPSREWTALADIELPIEGEVTRGLLTVRGEAPLYVGRRENGSFVFATPPAEHGHRRLRVALVEVTPPGEASVTDCWAGLPEPEDVLDSRFVLLDDEPMLYVTTKPAGKLAIFGEKRIRLFPLERDRSRLGRPAAFATISHMNLWQDGIERFLDVDADGDLDLVVGYWKGLIDHKVVLDAYLRNDDGTFRPEPRTTAFNVKKGDRGWLEYGTDLDRDGIPDLLLRARGSLYVFPGLPSSNGKRLVDKNAQLEISLGERDLAGESGYRTISVSAGGVTESQVGTLATNPRLADVDGDGRAEIILSRRGAAGTPGVLRTIRLD